MNLRFLSLPITWSEPAHDTYLGAINDGYPTFNHGEKEGRLIAVGIIPTEIRKFS